MAAENGGDGIADLITSGSPWLVLLGIGVTVAKFFPDILHVKRDVSRESSLTEREKEERERAEEERVRLEQRADKADARADREEARADRLILKSRRFIDAIEFRNQIARVLWHHANSARQIATSIAERAGYPKPEFEPLPELPPISEKDEVE